MDDSKYVKCGDCGTEFIRDLEGQECLQCGEPLCDWCVEQNGQHCETCVEDDK